MKRDIKKIDPAALISAAYFSVVWMTYIYLNLTTSVKITLMFTLFVGVASYFLFDFIIGELKKIDGLKSYALLRNKKLTFFFAVSIIVFLLRLIWILAYYPGSFSPDSIGQYGQALSGNYSDWHPVWHTILIIPCAHPLRL